MDANQKYTIKSKKQGETKYTTYGNVTPGERGPRMGLRVTPELRQLVAEAEDGKWLNFLMFQDSGDRKPKPEAEVPTYSADMEIPF